MNRYALSLLLTMSCLPAAVQAAELGRLFFTPQQRQQLDAQQAGGRSAVGGQRSYIIVNGVVQKHGGNRTVWINSGEAPNAGGMAGAKGAYALERITPQLVEDEVVAFVARVVAS